jgi:hypothetical protein
VVLPAAIALVVGSIVLASAPTAVPGSSAG